MENNIRLDKYLTQKFPQYSRAFLKSQIKLGNVLVNNKIKKPSYILKKEDKIQINIVKKEKTAIQPNPNIKLKDYIFKGVSPPLGGGDQRRHSFGILNFVTPRTEAQGITKLNIIYEDKNIIVIDKPAGISTHPAKLDNRQAQLVHPSKPEQNDTIANALLAYYPEIASVGDEPELRPGIVHRLDKETSGLMVVAKNNATFDWLKKQFAQRKVVKKYLALVMGNIKEKRGIITKPIGKTKDFRKRTTIPLKKQKEAITYYRVLKYYFEPQKLQTPLSISPSTKGERMRYTLVEAEPKTGRTHQIRVHFASLGHPLAGDKLYSHKQQTPLLGIERQFLHAVYLKFSLPDGRILELRSELPKELKNALKTIEA